MGRRGDSHPRPMGRKRQGGCPATTRRPCMHNVLVDGGMIRKLWIGEAEKYRDHLLRLDPDSRRNRFGGGVSDEFISNFVTLTLSLDAVVHGFFVDGVMRGAGELRTVGGKVSEEAEA